MKNNYVFEWLDSLINYELNPAFLHPSPMTAEGARNMIQNLQEEKQRIQVDLQQQIFQQKDETQMALKVTRYYEAIILLINKTYEHRQRDPTGQSGLSRVIEHTMTTLEELLAFFQTNYLRYLTLEQPLAVTHALELQAEVMEKKEALKVKLVSAGNSEDVTRVVTGALDDFIERIANGEVITKREARYHQALIRDIEDNKGQHTALSNCPSLHELLVYWNLNSKACIRYFTLGLDNIIKSNETIEEQLEFMRFQLKNIAQLPQVPDFIYNPAYPSLKDYFSDYLLNEIEYLEKKKIGFVPNATYEALHSAQTPFKVLCTLSGDQISLIIKTAHDLGIIIAKSVSAVYKAIVPFISTNQKEDLSWQSMRSKSANAEDRDKAIAIEVLEQMIQKIKES